MVLEGSWRRKEIEVVKNNYEHFNSTITCSNNNDNKSRTSSVISSCLLSCHILITSCKGGRTEIMTFLLQWRTPRHREAEDPGAAWVMMAELDLDCASFSSLSQDLFIGHDS